MRTVLLATVSLLCSAATSVAQNGPSATPQVPGDTVPSWVFYWVLGLSTVVGGGLLLVIRTLWDRTDRVSGLSENERAQLKQLYDWHNRVDENQVPLWYVPRAWLDLIDGLQEDHAAVNQLLTKISEQNAGINADLRQQLKERIAAHDLQQTKMLKLAVRVQQAVEALAGLAAPSIESDLDDERPNS
jgi:hypothetical protein